MAWQKCKSGEHDWDSSQVEELAKCCNGYTLMWVPFGYEENKGYDPWGGWCGAPVLVRSDDHKEIARIKALGPIEERATGEVPEEIQ